MVYGLFLHMSIKTVEGGSSHLKNSCIHGYKKPAVYGSYTLEYNRYNCHIP